MKNKALIASRNPLSLTPAKMLSRHKNSTIYTDPDTRISFVESWRPKYVPPSDKGLFFRVTSGEENNLDLVSYLSYGNQNLWWIIALINSIRNPLNYSTGIVLRIPDLSGLYSTILK